VHRASGTAGRFGLAETIGFDESVSFVEPGANQEAAMTMAPLQGLLKTLWNLENAVGMQVASAPRPARPSRQAPS